MYLMLHLEGPALEYAESLGDKLTNDVENLHTVLSDRFGAGERKQTSLDELLHFHRKVGETLLDYEMRLRSLLQYGHPKTDVAEREKMGVNYFITGLQPSRLAERLGDIFPRPNNLRDIRRAAAQLEGTESTTVHMVANNSREEELEERVARLESRVEGMAGCLSRIEDAVTKSDTGVRTPSNPGNDNNNNGNKAGGRDYICFNCGGRAHMARNCPSPKKSSNMDFMRSVRAVVDTVGETISVRGRPCPLQVLSIRPNVCRVSLAEDVTLPGRHEVVVPGCIQDANPGWGGFLSAVFEPNSLEGKDKVVCARTVVTPTEGSVPVRLVNTSPEPVTLRRGSKVGQLTPMDGGEAEEVVLPPAGKGRTKRRTRAQQVLTLRGLATKSSTPEAGEVDRILSDLGLDRKDLSTDQRRRVYRTVDRFQHVFSRGPLDLGRTDKVKHKIDTGSARPVKLAPRRYSPHQREEMARCLQGMREIGIIRESHSPWGAPVVLVKKPDGSTRFCVDYRKLNDCTLKDAYPLPRIDDALDALGGAKFFSTLDLVSGYHQVEVEESSKEKTAFTTPLGLWEFNTLPMGLCNSPATFERLMDLVLAGLCWSSCLVYLDDIIVFGRTFEEHWDRLEAVLQRLQDAGLKVKTTKCQLLREKVSFLGHVVSEQGVETEPKKVEAVKTWPIPNNRGELRSFLGFCSYYRRFVRNFSGIAAPLYQLANDREGNFEFGEEEKGVFRQLQRELTTAPVLAFPDFHKRFILDTDASDRGLGAVLSQEVNGCEHPIAYHSRTLSKAERKYCTTRKELLALVNSVWHFRHYLLGCEFTVRTDHHALKWLMTFKEPENQVARWLETLASFSFTVQHRAGKKHGNADGLSRIPCRQCGLEDAPTDGVMSVQVASDPPELLVPFAAGQDIKQQQADDPEISPVLLAVESGDETEQPSPLGKEGLRYWNDRERMEVKEGVLYRRLYADNSVLARPFQHRGPLCCDLDPLCCDLDPYAVFPPAMRERFFWYGMATDVELHVKGCSECAKRKTGSRRRRAPLVPSSPGFRWERVAMDFMGPFPETPKGNKHILVISDYMTKWVEAVALPDQKATTVVRALIDTWITRFGVPYQLHSDQGRDFDSQIVHTLCQELGIKKTRTTAYHPEGDGMVERFNRTVCQILTMYVNDSHTDWDARLQSALFAYRTSVHSSTDYTPFFLTYGEEARVPADVMWPVDRPEPAGGIDVQAQGVREELDMAYRRARQNMETAHRRQKDVYDRKCHGGGFSVGDQVWLSIPAVPRGLSKKFFPKWKGPYRVVTRMSDVTYRVQRVGGRQRVVVHFNRLKEYHVQEPEEETGARAEDSLTDELPAEETPAEDSDAGSLQDWVQCDSCDSWRRITAHEAAEIDPDGEWYCSMNEDQSQNVCDAPAPTTTRSRRRGRPPDRLGF
ncbi:RTL1 [Branchiostoma lanceolatum]|uniref:ribonuclease H n=1 Tax=Branchiostoma lanceolatum TaxID=7740 RepID=A0A8J9ZFR8_BRALA|nr:RTL1 [Branchiostoma lanceolatum]